jgi:hypothetical protein
MRAKNPLEAFFLFNFFQNAGIIQCPWASTYQADPTDLLPNLLPQLGAIISTLLSQALEYNAGWQSLKSVLHREASVKHRLPQLA